MSPFEGGGPKEIYRSKMAAQVSFRTQLSDSPTCPGKFRPPFLNTREESWRISETRGGILHHRAHSGEEEKIRIMEIEEQKDN